MVSYFYNRQSPSGRRSFEHPVANMLVVLVGALAIGAFVVIGLVAFLLLAAAVLVFTAAFGLRVWWINRRAVRSSAQARRHGSGITVIEGQYEDVSERRRSDAADD